MELRTLRSFVTVVRLRSFTLAAAELFLTQSAVSQQIRSLETELGTPLFVRERNGLELTEAANLLLATAQQIVSLADGIGPTLARHTPARGRLRIVAATVASSFLYARLYERFVSLHPDVVLETLTGIGREATLAALRTDAADVAFMQHPLEAEGLRIDELGETEIVAVGAPTRSSDQWMVWDGSAELATLLAKRDNVIAVRTNDISLLKRLVDAGVGVGLLPRWSVAGELAAGVFALVETGLPTVRQRFGLAYRAGTHNEALEAFVSLARAFRGTIAELSEPLLPP